MTNWLGELAALFNGKADLRFVSLGFLKTLLP
jgi:hypothetical protein